MESIPRANDAHYRAAANAMKARLQVGTRDQLLQILEDWEQGKTTQAEPPPVFVLVGEAGTGKSTVASEFAKRLQSRNCLGASFFFTRGVQDLSSPKKFFSTLASQLARSQPALRVPIIDAVREHQKTAILQQLEHEFEDLIAKPISTLPPDHSPILIVVDALDECTEDGPELVPTLLRLLLLFAVRPGCPLRVFLTSRPEPHYIHAAFTTPDLRPHVSIENIQRFRSSVDRDIEKLIRAMLNKYEASEQWAKADTSIVPGLVSKSEGLFIYARTAVEFIMGDLDSLQERYDLLLPLQPRPFRLTPIDTLYLVVLQNVFPLSQQYPQVKERLHRVLGYLVALQEPDGVSPETLQRLTGMPAAESVAILNKLRSVVFFERGRVDAPFRIIHATFREFLMDRSRSTDEFTVDAGQAHGHLAEACLKVLRGFKARFCLGTTGPRVLVRAHAVWQLGTMSERFAEVLYAHKHLDYHRHHSSSDICLDSHEAPSDQRRVDDDVVSKSEALLLQYLCSNDQTTRTRTMVELIDDELRRFTIVASLPNGQALLNILCALNGDIGRLNNVCRTSLHHPVLVVAYEVHSSCQEQLVLRLHGIWLDIINDIQTIATASATIPGHYPSTLRIRDPTR